MSTIDELIAELGDNWPEVVKSERNSLRVQLTKAQAEVERITLEHQKTYREALALELKARQLMEDLDKAKKSAQEGWLEALKPVGGYFIVQEERGEALAFLEKALPIVEAAFWDEHTAGTIPGSGYNHRAQHLAGQEWGWQSSEGFSDWLKRVRQLLEKR